MYFVRQSEPIDVLYLREKQGPKMDYKCMRIVTTHTFLQEYQQSRVSVTGGTLENKL